MRGARGKLGALVGLGLGLVAAACSGSHPVHTAGVPGANAPAPIPLGESAPGHGWRMVSLPWAPGGPQGGYTDSGSAIACSSATDCLFATTYLDRNTNQLSVTAQTTNAGRTWKLNTRFPSSLDGGISSAACDRSYCFIAAENSAVTDQALARSDDGRTWTLIPYPASWNQRSINAALIACSSSRCLVYGDNTFDSSPTKLPAGIVTAFAATGDDFKTWTDITIPGAGQIDQLACSWSGQCWAEYEGPGDDLQHVATTLDGGVTWTALGAISSDQAISTNSDLSFALDPDHQVGFACQDARTCAILDNSNNLVTTHDGGHTWSLAHGPSRGSTDALTCTPSSTCVVVSVDQPAVWFGPLPG